MTRQITIHLGNDDYKVIEDFVKPRGLTPTNFMKKIALQIISQIKENRNPIVITIER